MTWSWSTNRPTSCVIQRRTASSRLIGRVRLYLGHAEGRLVNRLDRETSGIVMVAKSRSVASELGRLFATEAVEKRYVAIVHGHLPSAPLVIDAPLGKDERSEVAIELCPSGRRAGVDGGQVPGAVPSRRAAVSLAAVTPRSGQKHQIRIHLAHAGFPIVGDKLYGGDEQCYLRLVSGTLTDTDRATLMLSQHALHAEHLRFHVGGARNGDGRRRRPAGSVTSVSSCTTRAPERGCPARSARR